MTAEVDPTAITKLSSKISPLREAWRSMEASPSSESLKILTFCFKSLKRSIDKAPIKELYPVIEEMAKILNEAENVVGEQDEGNFGAEFSRFTKNLQKLECIVTEHLPKIQPAVVSEVTIAQKNADQLKRQLTSKKQEEIRLALVDDDKAIGAAITTQLNDFGFHTELHASLGSIQEALNERTFDLVILDLVIDKSTDEQVFAFAKSCHNKEIEVVMMSSISSIDARLRAVRAGIRDYLVKPVTTSKLIAKLRKILNLTEQRPPRVLLLDDQTTVVALFSAILKSHGIDVVGITDVYRLLDELEDFVPDLFMLDFNMPEASGIEVATIIRQLGKYDYTPIVFLSADESEEAKLDILKVGSEDLILKSTPPDVLVNQVMSRIIRTRNIRELASSDSLTGVLNHGQIMEAAVNAFRQAKRTKGSCVICMIDLDKFKHVNDTYGHGAGDKVLIALGQLLIHAVRQTDFVGRYGGEEFIIVYQNSDLDFVTKKINQLRESFSALPFSSNRKPFTVTFSAGVAQSSNYTDMNSMMADADKALYKAKNQGRNQVVVAERSKA